MSELTHILSSAEKGDRFALGVGRMVCIDRPFSHKITVSPSNVNSCLCHATQVEFLPVGKGDHLAGLVHDGSFRVPNSPAARLTSVCG